MKHVAECALAFEDNKEVFDEVGAMSLKNVYYRIDHDINELKELEEKDVVLVVGRTGAGKSTLVNGIIEGPEFLNINDK